MKTDKYMKEYLLLKEEVESTYSDYPNRLIYAEKIMPIEMYMEYVLSILQSEVNGLWIKEDSESTITLNVLGLERFLSCALYMLDNLAVNTPYDYIDTTSKILINDLTTHFYNKKVRTY